jgi:hypothetical protein
MAMASGTWWSPTLVQNNVSILLGNGDGTFQPAVNYAVVNEPVSVAVGDFNGDGKRDLAVANYGGFRGRISILLGNGDGTFQPAVDYAVDSPTFVAVADFNGDGKRDLAVTNYDLYTVSILLGDGHGTFQLAGSYAVGIHPRSVAVGDFNGDGKRDLAVANWDYSLTLSILLGNGDGTFQPAVDYAVGSLPSSVAVGDFDGDRKPDLAVANGSVVTILLGNGDGTFQSASRDLALLPWPWATSIATESRTWRWPIQIQSRC